MKSLVRCLVLMLALLSGISFINGGCKWTGNSIVYVPDSKKAVTLDVNEPAPFAGVLITRGQFDYFLRCEDIVIQEGILP